MEPGDIIRAVKNLMFIHTGIYRVSITGGEPLLQDIKPLTSLLSKMLGKKGIVNIETNGTISPPCLVRVHWSVSPKLPSSGSKFSIPVIDDFAMKSPEHVQFKFVVRDTSDWEALKLLCTESNFMHRHEIWVQPAQVPQDTLQSYIDSCSWLALKAQQGIRNQQVRLMPQIHKLIWWDQKRGI
jgi:organic radical activating enzyme